MQQTITGLYLNHTNYGETSVILKLYTLQYGTTSFIVKGIKKKKGGGALLQPFHYLELSSNFRTDKDLNFGNRVRLSKASYSITSDIRKGTVAIFLTEVLNKTLRESAPNEEAYKSIESLINYYDEEDFVPLFHHFFLVQLIKLLGVTPHFKQGLTQELLHIQKGVFEYNSQPDREYFSSQSSRVFKELIGMKFDGLKNLNLTKITKTELLKNLITYIEVQTEIKRGSIKSYKILETIFHD